MVYKKIKQNGILAGWSGKCPGKRKFFKVRENSGNLSLGK